MVEDAAHAAKGFFALPDAEKRRWHVPPGRLRAATPRSGSRRPRARGGPDLKEFWHVGRELPPGHPYRAVMPDNLWPAVPHSFRPAVQRLYDALDELAHPCSTWSPWASSCRATGSATRRGWATACCAWPTIRRWRGDAQGVRAGAHEDINVITLLLGAEEAGAGDPDPRRSLAAGEPGARRPVVTSATCCKRPDQSRPALDHPPGGQSAAGAARGGAPVDAVLPALPAGFRDRDLASCVDAGNPDRYPEPITAHAYLQQRLAEIGLKARRATAEA